MSRDFQHQHQNSTSSTASDASSIHGSIHGNMSPSVAAFAFAPGTTPSTPISTFSSSSSSTSSPTSRRSSALNPLGDKFGRLGAVLPTVDENMAEKHAVPKPAPSPASSSSAGPATTPASTGSMRGHTRSKSMKEQLAQFGQDANKEGTPKTLQSLQEMISSLKSIPAVNYTGANNGSSSTTNNGSNGSGNGATLGSFDQGIQGLQGQSSGAGLSRHEKRLSMSSLPSRSSTAALALKEPSSPFPGSSSTTLHISQPPRGTSIENALQSTVATLRRLSVSDSRRPTIQGQGRRDEDSSPENSLRKTANRRSVALPQEFMASSSSSPSPSTGSDSQDLGRRNRRSVIVAPTESPYHVPSPEPSSVSTSGMSSVSGYQPNRRSVIIKPEEVAALQEGRAYLPAAARNASYSSDEDNDAVAGALSALEGKSSVSQRSGMASKSPHRRSVSSVDPGALAEFASRLPSHMQGSSSAAFQNFGQSLVNNDDVQDRRRFTTAFQSSSGGLSQNRMSVSMAQPMSSAASRRLSTMSTSTTASKDLDRKDWRLSTPIGSNGLLNRDSVSLKDSNGRRPLFQAHLTYSDFHSLLTKQKHKFVQGVLRINKRNRSDAYVTVDSLPEGDVYICGSKDRNRALEGDVVGIELIDIEDMPQQKLEGGKDKKRNKRSDDIEEAGDADVEDIKPKYCGRVVSIVERSLVQTFSGTLTLQRPSGSTKKNERRSRLDDDDVKGQPRIVWFKPTDKRVPLIAIPIDQAPEDFVDSHQSYSRKLFLATIKRWPLSSLHPFGHLERELGDIGNIEIETEALLADNNVTTTTFGEKVEKCLPELPWAIPEKELCRRRDLRQSCTFTIDPATAKDLDDAVSCIRLEDGTFEIGVHIADVSHFIKVGSALDREAKSRATTVYLVQKAIPMLPTLLSEDLCSLRANVDRLTFSIFWKMTEDGQILDTSFTKSVIRSCAQLSYDDAQRVITTGALDPKVEVYGHSRTMVEENIKTFFKLSLILRQKRFDNGALSINSIKLAFETDGMDLPLDVSVYELKESNRLIEEFMLLANMSVAKQIYDYFPEQALLRRQEEPLEKRTAEFIEHMNKIGLELDASSSGALQTSMDAIQDPDVRKVVRLLLVKPMHRAKYICGGMLSPEKHHHYSLNAPLYTHFTSPIRRYADIIVHRLLEASLTGESKFYLNKESCQKSANQCNLKKDAARLAQEQSNYLYLSALLKTMMDTKGPVIREAIVMRVHDTAFDVLVDDLGLEKRVHLDQLPLESYSYIETTETLKLYWGSQAFKSPDDDSVPSPVGGPSQGQSNLMRFDEGHVGAFDHPDDVTNAYDDERGLFDDESDYEDEDGVSPTGAAGTLRLAEAIEDDSSTDAANMTRVKAFGRLSVLVTADTSVSPSVIKVVAMNPFVTTPTVTLP